MEIVGERRPHRHAQPPARTGRAAKIGEGGDGIGEEHHAEARHEKVERGRPERVDLRIGKQQGQVPLLLGRHPECDIQIESRKISRRHCCIAQVEDYLVVRDLDSTNGTWVDQQKIVPGQPRVLRAGSRLRVGDHELEVRDSRSGR